MEPLLLLAARISVAMAAPTALHALRLNVAAAEASTGKMVGQCRPMHWIAAPWRISHPQACFGTPSRVTPFCANDRKKEETAMINT
jgi:hypothetical protein